MIPIPRPISTSIIITLENVTNHNNYLKINSHKNNDYNKLIDKNIHKFKFINIPINF